MNPVLQGIEAAALAIADERARLNSTFESLRRAAATFDPTIVLLEDGHIVNEAYAVMAVVDRVIEDDRAEPATDEPQAPPVTPSEDEPPVDASPPKPHVGSAYDDSILEYVRRMGIAVSTSSIKQAMGGSDSQIKAACNHLRDHNLLVRTPLGLYRATTEKERLQAALPAESPEERENNEQMAARVRQANEQAERARQPGKDDSSSSASNGKAKRTVTPQHWTQRPNIVEAEKRKKSILDHLNNNAGHDYLPQEIAEEVGIERHNQVSEDLRDMIDRGIPIAVKKNHRRPKGVEKGRFSNAYVVIGEPAQWIDAEGKNVDPTSLEATPV